MIDEKELLGYICQTTEMGQVGIDQVLPHTEGTLQQALKQQRREYEKLYRTASNMLEQRGGEVKKINPVSKLSSGMMTSMKTMMDSSPSKIAEMMIQGNTMGVTKSIRTLDDYHGSDHSVRGLANQLLDTENANIEQMKKFL